METISGIIEEGILADMLGKHTDPLEFAAEVLTAIRSGELTLKPRGAANTRELVKLFYAHKTKKRNKSKIRAEQRKSPSFRKYISEAKVNKHLTHIEDSMYIDGYAGFMSSMCVLGNVVNTLSGNSTSRSDITSKADGCVHEDTVLMTCRGEMTIREFHDRFSSGEQLSVMGKDEQKSLDIMTNVHNSYASHGHKEWIKITTECGDSLVITTDHEIHTTNRGWIKAIDIKPGDDITELQQC